MCSNLCQRLHRIVVILIVSHASIGVNSAKIVSLQVPVAVKIGQEFQIECHYNLKENEQLYTLKWFKGGAEFYRYMPKEHPSEKIFNVSGVRIMKSSESVRNSVTLRLKAENTTTGIFGCEISPEGSFEEEKEESFMSVVEPPIGKPFITLNKATISINNESIIANCSGPSGRPTPQLIWYFASEQIPTDRNYSLIGNESSDRVVSMLQLPSDWLKSLIVKLYNSKSGEFHLNEGPFVILHLRCTSTILGLFETSDTVDIRIRRESQTTLAPKKGLFEFKQSSSISYRIRKGFSAGNWALIFLALLCYLFGFSIST